MMIARQAKEFDGGNWVNSVDHKFDVKVLDISLSRNRNEGYGMSLMGAESHD